MPKLLLPAAALLLAFSTSFADNHETAEVDPSATWDLTELFPTVEAWDAARQEVLAELPPDSVYTPEIGKFNLEFNLDPVLFGGDAGPGRWGLRTDTMILVTIHEPTGRTAW